MIKRTTNSCQFQKKKQTNSGANARIKRTSHDSKSKNRGSRVGRFEAPPKMGRAQHSKGGVEAVEEQTSRSCR